MDIRFSATLPDGGARVVGVWEGGNAAAPARAPAIAAQVERALAASPGFTGREGQMLTLLAPAGLPAERLVLLGLGAFGGIDAHRTRRLGAAVAAELACAGPAHAGADLDLPPEAAVAFAQGAVLRAHRPMPWRTRLEESDRPMLEALTVRLPATAAAEALWTAARAEAEGVLLARDLVDAPGNVLTPAALADHAAALATLGVRVEIVTGVERLGEHGFGLLAAVGRASAQPPALITLTWNGLDGGRAPAAPLVLVGKGITFDSGGLCMKPAEGMERMKTDMGGAAAVLATLHALARMRSACHVVGILAVAENMPGGGALRPGDVLRAGNGMTVEVVDTDAEGRLVLADALVHAARLKPRAVIDVATLTGSVVTALGRHMAGLFCTDDRLAAVLREAGEAAGEPLWPLPLTPALDDDLKSDIADILQCAPAGPLLPDALHAAAFLRRFAPPGVPWAHLDIAGMAHGDEDRPLSPRGATGFGVRLLTAVAARTA